MAVNFTYVPIATTTLASAAASYTFSSIPSTYKDLVIITNTQMTANGQFSIYVNGDNAGTTYSWTELLGNGTAASSNRSSGNSTWYFKNMNDSTTAPTIGTFNFMNYANTTTYKTMLARTGSADKATSASACLWRNTNAISSITLLPSASTWIAGSTLTLYGIAGA